MDLRANLRLFSDRRHRFGRAVDRLVPMGRRDSLRVFQRTGTIFKFSRKGLAFKSWEGQLMIGAGRDNSGAVVPIYWDFSCADPDVAKRIEEAQRKQHAVTIEYSQQLVRNARIANTSYYAVGVKEQDQ